MVRPPNRYVRSRRVRFRSPIPLPQWGSRDPFNSNRRRFNPQLPQGQDRLLLGLIGIFSVLIITTLVVGFNLVSEAFAPQKTTARAVTPTVIKTAIPQGQVPVGPLQAKTGPTPIAWDGSNRVNVLLMGLDLRDWQAGEPSRTDTMILFTMDPDTQTAGMLSIPRDLWVEIPGQGGGKINTAYFYGDAYKLPGGGPGMAVKTVENFLGITINYYAQVDFNAVVGLIDEIGGVKINVTENLTVSTIGSKKVFLKPGVQTLPGDIALAYARNRSTPGGDLDRARRQQQVIMAVRDRVLNINTLPQLIIRSPAIYKKFSDGIKTNLTLDQIISLAYNAQKIPFENIKKGVFTEQEAYLDVSWDGQSILVPVPDKIRMLRDQIFSTKAGPAPVPTAPPPHSEEPTQPQPTVNPVAKMKEEAATIALQNASGKASFTASVVNFMKVNELNLVEQKDLKTLTQKTAIYDNSGKTYTVNFLAKKFGVEAAEIHNRYDPNAKADITLVLGTEQKSIP